MLCLRTFWIKLPTKIVYINIYTDSFRIHSSGPDDYSTIRCFAVKLGKLVVLGWGIEYLEEL